MTRSIKIVVPDDFDARPLAERDALRGRALEFVSQRLALWTVRLRPDEQFVVRLEPDPAQSSLNVARKGTTR